MAKCINCRGENPNPESEKCEACKTCLTCGGAGMIFSFEESQTVARNEDYNPKKPDGGNEWIKTYTKTLHAVKCPDCYRRLLKNISGLLPGEYRRAIMSNLNPAFGSDSPALIHAVNETLPGGANYFLSLIGASGTGKTSALHILTRAYCENGVKAKYMTTPDLIGYLQEGVKADDYENRLSNLIKVPFLALDELDKVNGAFATEWQKQQLFKVVDSRYRRASEESGRVVTAIAANALPHDEYMRSRLLDKRHIALLIQSEDLRLADSADSDNAGDW